MRIGRIAAYLSDFALFWPGILVTVVASVALGRRVGSALGRGPLTGGAFVFSLGLIASATLTPGTDAIVSGAVGTGTCDVSRIGLASLGDVLALGDPGFNILLFLPLGVVLGSLPRGRTAAVLIGGALVLSPAIEMTQLVVRVLDRACQTSDVVVNLTGLVVGLATGAVLGFVVARLRPAGRGPRPDPAR
jgi:hypothetical protein